MGVLDIGMSRVRGLECLDIGLNRHGVVISVRLNDGYDVQVGCACVDEIVNKTRK